MPMCQSPRIADVLLRARATPANDNRLPADKSAKLPEAEGVSGPGRRMLQLLFRLVAPVVAEMTGRFRHS
jgi:hypothetical protein